MKEVYDIILRLTISAVLAAVVMGSVFMMTDTAKRHNQHVNEQKVMLGLLGYSQDNPAPESTKLYNVFRYIVSKGEEKLLGYILPLKAGSASANQLVTIDLQGKFAGSFDLQIPPEKLGDIGERDIALAAALPGDMSATFADEVIVVNDGAQRRAYLLPGSFPGFKTFIKVFLALDPQLAVLGYEIVEQEEDPGLGDEIKKDYFKNQFAGKTLEQMKSIKVIKVPLPDEYRRYLERNLKGIRMSEEEIAAIREKYGDVDIHALTGATISSEAVSNGLKSMLKKFAYRLRILDEVVNRQAIPVAF